MTVTPAGGVKRKSLSLTGTFSCMPVKVNSVTAPSTSSRRMAWMAPAGGDGEGEEFEALLHAFGNAGDAEVGACRALR